MGQCWPAPTFPLNAEIQSNLLSADFLALPQAELHVHLEGSLQPGTVCALAAKYGVPASTPDVLQRYAYRNFLEFIETFKWVSSLLRAPEDFALALRDLGEQLLAQNVVYAEITLSVGVMLLRHQSPEKNFEALVAAAESLHSRGLQLNFVFDAARQFGTDAAMKVVEAAERCASRSIVAFGIGGDELSIPAKEFRAAYDKAAGVGLHKLMHAGEVGGPEEIRQAIELLGAERIGHGIAAVRDRSLMDLLAERHIPLEICPQSNVRTGALAKQLSLPAAPIEQHPLPQLFRHGIPVVLSTDDPAMFHTDLRSEYENAHRMGLQEAELIRIAKMSFEYAFIDEQAKAALQRRGKATSALY
ncbi:MAG: aminodeoxyfutalosine deaminase [Acidobacteriaceae bacterium]|nr:aminodeoxyfutalosine deaminase [Acidobacteriaceae bacterium]